MSYLPPSVKVYRPLVSKLFITQGDCVDNIGAIFNSFPILKHLIKMIRNIISSRPSVVDYAFFINGIRVVCDKTSLLRTHCAGIPTKINVRDIDSTYAFILIDSENTFNEKTFKPFKTGE